MKSFANQEAAEKEFKKKFKDKTKNNWDDRSDFTPHSGKYTLLEMDDQDSQEVAELEEKVREWGIKIYQFVFIS